VATVVTAASRRAGSSRIFKACSFPGFLGARNDRRPAALGLPAEVGESGLDEPDRRRWRPTRLQISLGIWVVFVGLLLAKWRVTTNQTQLFVIIGTGLIAAGAGRLHHIGQVVKDWFPSS